MFNSATIQGGATPNNNETCFLVNRTGAALAKGDVVALNLNFGNTAGQEMVGLTPSVDTDGAAGYVYGAAIAVTTENATRRLLVYVGDEPLADNAVGLFCSEGIIEVKVNGANAGEFLVGANGQTYLTPLTLTEIQALTTQVGIVGIALAASTGAQVKKIEFCGAAWKQLCGGDT